ncbi:MAG: hypothetical protein AAF541_16590 [Pseudomonadota bacterium]
MSIRWLFKIRPRWLLPVLLLLFIGLSISLTMYATEGGLIRETFAVRQVVGTVLMFTLVPAYLLWGLFELHFRTLSHLEGLGDTFQIQDLKAIRDQADALHPAAIVLILLGAWYGFEQNSFLFSRLLVDAGNLFDYVFLGANVLVWVMIALLFSWRVLLSFRLSQAGSRAAVDLYHLDRLKPVTRIALVDVLIVAGAMAFMPLQALDAEFRAVNYQAGLIVGVPAAIVFFFLPLYGLSRRLRSAKLARLLELQQELDKTPRHDLVQLETVMSHIARIRGISNVPLDLSILWRIFVYVIIPPIAWVFAALVENVVDNF